MFLVQVIVITVIPSTDAYRETKEYLLNNEQLKSEVGNIIGFGLMPTGGIAVQTDLKGETGNANINLIVKGDRAFKSVSVIVFKDYGKDRKVYEVE